MEWDIVEALTAGTLHMQHLNKPSTSSGQTKPYHVPYHPIPRSHTQLNSLTHAGTQKHSKSQQHKPINTKTKPKLNHLSQNPPHKLIATLHYPTTPQERPALSGSQSTTAQHSTARHQPPFRNKDRKEGGRIQSARNRLSAVAISGQSKSVDTVQTKRKRLG